MLGCFKFRGPHVATLYSFLIPGTPVAVRRCFADKNKPSLDAIKDLGWRVDTSKFRCLI